MSNDQLLKRLSDSTSLTDVLIQMEDFMDSLDLYVFKNWMKGEIVEGPIVKRHWVSIKLKYDFQDMPDPSGGERLVKHGAKVAYQQSSEEVIEANQPKGMAAFDQPAMNPNPEQNVDPNKPKTKTVKFWLVEVTIPRRFIEELDDSDLGQHEDEVDVEDVSDARDENIDEKDAFTDEDGDGVADGVQDDEDEEEQA